MRSQEQLQGLFVLEKAYLEGVSRAEKTLSRWRRRLSSALGTSDALTAAVLDPAGALSVSRGLEEAVGYARTVGKFGGRVVQLMDEVRSGFLASTRGSVMVKERSSRLAQLMRFVTSEVSSMFDAQVQSLRYEAERRMRAELLRLAAKTSVPDSASALASSGKENRAELEDEARRQVLQWFRLSSQDIQVPSLGLLVDVETEGELEAQLRKLCKDFSSSAVAKALAMQQMEKQIKRSAARSDVEGELGRKRGIGVSLSLVGMLRPPGYGNIQGVVSYVAPALLGGVLPLSLVLGFQNDADTPEVLPVLSVLVCLWSALKLFIE